MKPDELKAIRDHMGLTPEEFGAEMGLAGSPSNNAVRILEYERGKKFIPSYLARLAFMLQEHFDAEEGHLPEWPESCAVHPGRLPRKVEK